MSMMMIADDDDVDEHTLLMRDCQGWQSEARAYQGAITCFAALLHPPMQNASHCEMHPLQAPHFDMYPTKCITL